MKKPNYEEFLLSENEVKEFNLKKDKFLSFLSSWQLVLISSLIIFFYFEIYNIYISIFLEDKISTMIALLFVAILFGIPIILSFGFIPIFFIYILHDYIFSIFSSKQRKINKYEYAISKYDEWFKRTKTIFWQSLSGYQFEEELALLFSKQGYNVSRTGRSGDKGIDLILDKKIIVQCKAHKKPISPNSIRDLIGTMESANYKSAILASVNGFTSGVSDYTKNRDIKLLDLNHFIQMQRDLN